MTGNWGQDIALLLEGGGRRRPQGQLVHLLCRRRRRTDRDQADRPREPGVPDQRRRRRTPATRRRWISRRTFRAKTGLSLWYPRAVNEMRMFKAAAEKANSIDPVKVAAALEDMKFEVFDGGEGFMRKDDHQFFQPIYISSFGSLADKTGAVRRGKHRLGLAPGLQDRYRPDHAADHLQHEAALIGRLRMRLRALRGCGGVRHPAASCRTSIPSTGL